MRGRLAPLLWREHRSRKHTLAFRLRLLTPSIRPPTVDLYCYSPHREHLLDEELVMPESSGAQCSPFGSDVQMQTPRLAVCQSCKSVIKDGCDPIAEKPLARSHTHAIDSTDILIPLDGFPDSGTQRGRGTEAEIFPGALCVQATTGLAIWLLRVPHNRTLESAQLTDQLR